MVTTVAKQSRATATTYFVVGDYPFTEEPKPLHADNGKRDRGLREVIELYNVPATDGGWKAFVEQLDSDEIRALAEKGFAEYRASGGLGSRYAIFGVRTTEGKFSARMAITSGDPAIVRIVGVDTSDLTRVLIGIEPRDVAARVAQEKARRFMSDRRRERHVIGIMCVVTVRAENSGWKILLTEDAVNPPELFGAEGCVFMGACLFHSVPDGAVPEEVILFSSSEFPFRFKWLDRETLTGVLRNDPRRTRSKDPFNRFSTNILDLVQDPDRLRADLGGYIQDAYRFFGLLD